MGSGIRHACIWRPVFSRLTARAGGLRPPKRREVLPSAAREKKKLLVLLIKRYSLFSNGHLAMKTEDEENTGLNLKLILLKLCFDYLRFQKSQQ